MQNSIVSIIALSGLFALHARALEKPMVRIEPMLQIARATLIQETAAFNELRALPAHSRTHRTPTTLRKKLRAQWKYLGRWDIREIAAEVPLAKCIFDEADFANLLSPVWTLKDDETYAKKNGLAEVSSLMGQRMYEVLYGVCERAREKFATRLRSVKFRNEAGEISALKISRADATAMASAIFLPTVEGKQTWIEKLRNKGIAFPLVRVAASLGGIFMGLPSLIMSGFYITDEVSGTRENAQAIHPNLYRNPLGQLANAEGLIAELTVEDLSALESLK